MKHLYFLIFLFFSFHISIGQTIVKMEKKDGVYYIPCKVNGLSLSFVFDTGASDVIISLSEALFMLKNGYIDEKDLTGTEYYRIANGDLAEGTKLLIRKFEIGDKTLYNIEASIVHSLSAPLLLGQSALSKFGSVSIDFNNNEIKLGEDEEQNRPNQNITPTNRKFENEAEQKSYYYAIIDSCVAGKFIDAAMQYINVLLYDLHDNKGYLKRADFYYELEDYSSAIKDYTTWINTLENEKRKALEKKTQDTLSLSSYNSVISYNLFKRSKCKYFMEDYRGAVDDCNKSIVIHKNNFGYDYYDVYNYLGSSLYKLGDTKGAMIAYNNSIKLNNEKEWAYFSRGLLNIELGNKEAGCLDLSKAGELGYSKAYEEISKNCK